MYGGFIAASHRDWGRPHDTAASDSVYGIPPVVDGQQHVDELHSSGQIVLGARPFQAAKGQGQLVGRSVQALLEIGAVPRDDQLLAAQRSPSAAQSKRYGEVDAQRAVGEFAGLRAQAGAVRRLGPSKSLFPLGQTW
jgi:hypothetical protein